MRNLIWLGVVVAGLGSRVVMGQQGGGAAAATAARNGVAVMFVDTDRPTGEVDERIYGQFLEHINHSVEDGLYAEQIRGQGFEGPDFETYWTSFAERGAVEVA